MRYAVVLTLASFLLGVAGLQLGLEARSSGWIPAVLLLLFAVSLQALATCYYLGARGIPIGRVLAGPRGVLPWILLAPYRGLAIGTLRMMRRIDREHARDEVAPGLWLGRWPFAEERVSTEADGISAVLNLCAEFRPTRWPAAFETLHVPLLDGIPPHPSDLTEAVRWAIDRHAEGRGVLIHCAQGHGRSALILVAVLIHLGQSRSIDDALRIIQSRRPRAKPSRDQLRALEVWLATPP